MAKKNISTALEAALVANESFEYAHLVKFERPFTPKDGQFRTNANRYVYITDAQRDLTYDGDIYRAQGLISVGSYSETTQARATNMTLSLAGEQLGAEVQVTGTFTTSGVFNATTTVVDNEVLDFVELGFREGDLVEVKRFNNLNFSDGATQKRFIISSFSSNNQSITFARTGTDTDDSAFLGSELSSSPLIFTLVNQEYKGTTIEKGTSAEVSTQVSNSSSITLSAANSKIQIGQLVSGRGVTDEVVVTSINGTALKVNKSLNNVYPGTELSFTNPSFINREVFVYKVFINPDTGAFFGDPILTFKGIIASANLQENVNASRVQWSLTSHWGDFNAVTGRIGTDEIHRSLDANGVSNSNLTIRPEYAGDLGFFHAETSLNTLANYQTTETRFRQKSKKRGGLAGLIGLKKYYLEEYQVQVDNEVDLSVYLQGRHIPVAYGVQRIEGVPVFADTLNNDSKVVYVAYTLAEGEIHGIYNLYIDGAPLICVDKNDADVRGTAATNSDSQSLQCYGRMDRGGTLGGQNASTGNSDQYHACEELAEELEREDMSNQAKQSILQNCYENYTKTTNSSDISGLVVDENAEGLQHEESAKISHPFAMEFTFHNGRSNQKANNLLATVAKNNNFKRQNDYYTSSQPYWGPNHRLLDTAYAVLKFTIEADQTTIPEVEYVIKGKVLECFNYDGTFMYDSVKNASNTTNDFNEGDTVTVEVSANGSSWSSDGNGNYRILDKYLFTTSRNSSHHRFRLDKLPVLGNNTFVRLKQGSNFWYMLAHDHALPGSGGAIQSQALGVTSFQTNSSGALTATLTSAGQTAITSIYGSDATNSASTSKIRMKFSGGTGEFASLETKSLQATYTGNTLTFIGQSFTANQSNLSGLSISPDRFIDLSDDLGTLTAPEVIGHTFKNVSTGEEKEIIGYTPSTKRIELESGLARTPETSHTYTITGKGKDLRASTNPAIQTLDLLTNERYGKGLSVTNDIDLDSVKLAARLCDTRSDITIPLASTATCVSGDIYKLVDGSGNHVASGTVKTSTSSSSSVVLTDVSGKFTRSYQTYITYGVGDIVSNVVSGEVRYYRVTNASSANGGTAPVHGSGGTTNGFQHLTSGITLNRVSGSGPSTLTMAVDNRSVQYSLYDADFIKYWRYLGWEENRQWCVTRHQTNFIFATERSIFENINALLTHYNGILSYSNGKYVLDVETAENTPTESNSFNGVNYDWNVNPEYIDNSDIIGGITLNDNAQKNAKNTIKASISDPQNNFGSRSVSFFNSDFLKADRNVIKTGSYPVTGITNYYNARVGVEKELIQSRFSKEISFTIGQKGLLLKPGAVIAITYDPFDFSSKLFRIENLTHNANCTTSIKAREYDDTIYAITPQIATKSREASSAGDFGLAIPGTPASLTTTNTKPGVITLNWSNASDYKEVIDSTEIWRASSQGSSGDITSHATLLTVVDNATTFSDAVGSAGTFYYWIRHRRMSRRTSDNAAVKLVGEFSTTITNGVSGVAKVPSAQLDVDVSAIQFRFNASNALTPGGANQDVKLTATLRGITANNVTFQLVDTNGNQATDGVVFTNNSKVLVDTTAPYEATVDASEFLHDTENKFVKVTATDTASSEVFTELVPVTVTKDGSSGSVGIDAVAVKLLPSTHVVSYSATGGENTTVSFTTQTQGTSGFSGTAHYQFIVAGGTPTTNTTGTFTLNQADEPANNTSKNVVVKLFDGDPTASAPNTGTLKATDSVTIFGVKDGSDAITAFLTNPSHVVPTNNAGAIDSSLVSSGNITSAGGTFRVFVGATERTTSCTYTVDSETGVDVTIGANTGAYTVSSTGLSDLGTANLEVTIPNNVSPTGQAVTLDQVYTIAKSKQGTAGAGGSDAKTVQLTAADYSVVYDEDGANPSPSGTITLTASQKNFSDPRFEFVIDGTSGGFSNSTTGSFTVPNTIFNTPKTMQVNVKEDGESVEAFDSISIFAVKSGTDAYTVIMDNEAHAIPADSDGSNPVFTGTGCTITAFKGSTELNGITTGTPSTGQFKVTVSSDTNITVGSQTSSGNPVIFADHSALTAATANIIYSINLENTQTVLKKQTFTRVDKGDDSRNSAEVKIYKRSNNATATANEAVPNNNTTYTFSTKAWPGSGNQADGWSLTQPTSGGKYLWSTTARVVGAAGADVGTIAEADWATPIRAVIEDPRTARSVLFYDAWNYGSAPDNPTITQGSFNFDTGLFTSLPSGWDTAIGTLPYYVLEVIITEATFGGTQTYTFGQGRGIGEWRKRNPRDIEVNIDDTNHKVQIRGGSDLPYQSAGEATITKKYKNDEISFTFSENNIQLTKYTGEVLTRNTPSQLKNSQITTNADGTLNYDGTTAAAPSIASIGGILPRTKGGFGLNIDTLLGTGTGKLPRWNGSTWVADNDTDFKNSQIIDSNGNIKNDVSFALPGTTDVFSPTEFKNVRESFDNIGSTPTLKAAKVPINTGFFEVDSNVIKIKDDAIGGDQISSSTTITAGTGTDQAHLDGTGTLRIYAGSNTAGKASAPFRVSQDGELSATKTTLGSTSGIALNVSTGTKTVQINTPTSTAGTVFQAGGDATSSYIPLKVAADGSGVLRGFDIFTSDGTKVFDKSSGLTDAAITVVAQATGSAVSTISKTTSSETASDAQKITNGDSGQTVTIKALKDGDGMSGFDTGSVSGAINDIPSSITIAIKKSANADLSSPSTIATKTLTRITSGSPSSTTYLVETESESEPGFEFHFATMASSNSSAASSTPFDAAGDIIVEGTVALNADEEVYFFSTITGAGGNGQGSNNRTATATRTLTVTAESGNTFTIDESGDSTGSGAEGDITAVVAGTGMTGGATSGSATLNVIGGDGITVNADEVEVAVDNTTIELSATSGSGTVKAKTAAIADGGTALATADQIHTFVTGQGYTTNTGTVTEAFKTIAVSGQSNVIADSATDTLTLAAGSNMTITTNASGDTITFASSGGGGSSLPSGMTYSSNILDVTGQIRATGDVTAFFSSDRRFKDNIKVIDNALEKVDKIRGVEFDWNEKSEYEEFGHDIGVIAQEVETAVPEIVIERDDGYKAVNYQKLTALLIQAVKELKEEIKELKKDK